MRSERRGKGLVPETALTNAQRLDLSKDFFPLGVKPQFGDVFYLACREPFSAPGAVVTLHVQLTNPASIREPSPISRVNAARRAVLAWEFWNGRAWAVLEAKDETNHLTDNGAVTFTVPASATLTTIPQGGESAWLRVRLVSGDYGEPERFQPIDPAKPGAGYHVIPSTLSPPSIRSISVDYTVKTESVRPETVLAYNDFRYNEAKAGEAFDPFAATSDTRPSLYLGFDLPKGAIFPPRSISLYFKPYHAPESWTATRHAPAQPRLLWQYWNGTAWMQWTVLDETASLTRNGLLRFLAPTDAAEHEEFGRSRYWLRTVWEKGEFAVEPRLRRLLMNTTIAAQTETVRREVIGSSNLTKNQKFRTTRAPVLPGQHLEVRELEPPIPAEKEAIRKEEGEDAIAPYENALGSESWVRWHEVPDFYGSEKRDRHYILDHLTGDVQFGDDVNGMIPPAGGNNIRLSRYQTGGGAAGNKSMGTVVQLKTTVPLIDKVTNLDAASGGADAETLESVVGRAPRDARHRDRAVSFEDYKDLARLASTEVARARCVPLYDLAVDPDCARLRPGAVSLIVVPRSAEDKPLPNLELIRHVRDYLDHRRTPTADLVIVGAEYVCVHVETELALSLPEDASRVQLEAERQLVRFLHPLSGGFDGAGWDFGRRPHKSDLYALLEQVPGVEYVRTLQVTEEEERSGAAKTDRFLIYSGRHKVSLTFEKLE
jgi:hypothetical protein